MSKKNLIWRTTRIVLGAILGIVLLLLIAVTVILVTPKARTAVLQSAWRKSTSEPTWMWIWGGSIFLLSIILR